MSNLPEQPAWESGIHQLEQSDRAKAGPGGILNLQALQLANRTSWLRILLESASDYREYTFYTTESDPDGTIAGLAGTPAGNQFRVIIFDAKGVDIIFRYYLNESGTARFINEYPSARYLREAIKDFYQVFQKIYVSQQIQAETQSQITNDNESAITALQHISLSLQVISEIIFSQENTLNDNQNNISHINTAIQVLSETLFSLGVSDSQTRNTIQSLSTSLQIVIDAINLAPSARDLDGARLQSLLNLSLLASELYKLDGLDTNATGGGGSAGATEITDGVYAFPSPARIVRIDITSPRGVPASKADGAYQGRCKVDIDGVSLTTFSTIAVQGSSSAGYPKKNLTIAFYSDESYSDELELKIGDGLAFSEWVYKANYIDSTHSRNLIGYTLWTQMQNTRDTWPRREVDHYYVGKTGLAAVDTGATGIPKGYPCIVYINSEFYGIGGLMIGKKKANYNIAKNVPEQIYLEFQNCDIRTINISNPDICEVTAPSNVTATVNGYLDVWRTFAQLPQSEFSAALPEHMDKMNASDYYILMMFLCAVDCFNKNMLFMTWDAQKWFCMPYDLDTTFGLNASGRAIAYGPTLNPITQGFTLPGNKEFWAKVYTAIGSDINARYAQLRNSGVLSVGNVSRIMTDLQSKYTIDMFEREFTKWTGLPSKDITSNDQLLSWLTQRMVWLDQYFSYE
ncbi:CotH kinase family protein [Klebsiella quasipneumoniae]|uniref:CotH kinase family protein n=1 Tax=Klebsiella quasipneumoniae TaxID=1463165 RepID=UPI0039757230